MAGLAHLLFVLSGKPTATAHMNLTACIPVGKTEPAKTAIRPYGPRMPTSIITTPMGVPAYYFTKQVSQRKEIL